MSDSLANPTRTSQTFAAPVQPRLGEELPIFCERCGYSLFGLPQMCCDQCEIRHFRCPECGHRQPINTLRPAVQRILGRIRGWVLGAIVFFKIAFVGFFLFMWFVMGAEWAYTYNWDRANATGNFAGNATRIPVQLSADMVLGFSLFGIAFGMVCRMLLLRWRRGVIVGLWLGALVVVAILLGARFYQWEASIPEGPFQTDFLLAVAIGFAAVVIGGAIAWPIWHGLVQVFLPAKTGKALLDWQRGLSEASATLGRAE